MPNATAGGLAAIVCAVSLISPRPSSAQALERLFYYVDREDSYQSLVKNIDQITVLGPQVYTVDSLGVILVSSILASSRSPKRTR
jgi:hypothetical protein